MIRALFVCALVDWFQVCVELVSQVGVAASPVFDLGGGAAQEFILCRTGGGLPPF